MYFHGPYSDDFDVAPEIPETLLHDGLHRLLSSLLARAPRIREL